jgi:hypothetical protein
MHRRLAPLTIALAALLGGCAREAPPPPVPDTVDRFGALELITHTRAYRSANSSGFGRTRDWSLRWQGQPLVIPTRGGMFGDQPQKASGVNAVFVLGRGPLPELIVNVGDPNNTSAFHALRQLGDTLQMPLLCLSSGGDNDVGWVAESAQARVWNGPQHEVLEGGRLLMLGSRCLYDVQQRRVLRVPQAPDMSVWTSVPPVAVSPDGRSLVRFGSVDGLMEPARGEEPAGPVPHLLVAELEEVSDWPAELGAAPRGRWQALRIDRRRMRYASHENDINASWLQHHFEWKHGVDGRDRLVPRSSFKPLPWRGVFLNHGGGEYKVDTAQQDLRPLFLALLQQRFDAKLLAPPAGEDPRYTQVAVRGETLTLHPLGFYAKSGRPYFPGQPGDPKLQQALVKEVGEAVDAELATGRHDAKFNRP